MKRDKTVYVFDGLNPWPPEDAAGFIGWFQEQLAKIPPVFSSTARIEIDVSEFNDHDSSPDPGIRITYTRLETDEEESKREAREAYEAGAQRARELKTLADLKAKYEPAGDSAMTPKAGEAVSEALLQDEPGHGASSVAASDTDGIDAAGPLK